MGLFIYLLFVNNNINNRDQNAGRIHSVRMDNSTYERVEEFKYLGTALTNQNAIQEEIKCRLRSGNACYFVFQAAIQKYKDQDICLLFCMEVKLGR